MKKGANNLPDRVAYKNSTRPAPLPGSASPRPPGHWRPLLLIGLLLLSLSCSLKTEPESPPPEDPALKKEREELALVKQELERISSKYFDVLPPEEREDPVKLAKRINAFTYNHCTAEEPVEYNVNRLLFNCRTACGGFVHVFRLIAEHYGITSRLVYLFNIPFQGNHVMVEVRYGNDKWALFDPTNGTFFTSDGNPSDTPYSLDDLYFLCTPDTIVRNISQARKTGTLDMDLPLDALYARNSFHASYLEPSAYLRADAYGRLDPNEYSLLWKKIDMQKDSFLFGGPVTETADGEKKFLSLTNALLNDDIPGNHISYNMSYLGEIYDHSYKNGYHFSSLRKGRTYRITVYGTNRRGASLYPHFTDSRAVLQRTGRHTVPKGAYEYSMLFRARDTRADLILEVYPGTGPFMRLFGIHVELCGRSGIAQ